MLKRFIPQKPMPPVREEPRYPDTDDNNHSASREESKTPTIIDNPNSNPMADHGGKDILSSDVEIKGSIKFQKELLIDGKVEGDINSDGILTVGENRSEEHTSELQSHSDLVCRLLLEKNNSMRVLGAR